MIWIVFRVVISVVLTEALTQIITKSLLFLPLRAWFFNRKHNKILEFIHELLDCGYCMSVWVGCFCSILLLNDIKLVFWPIDWFLWGLIVHRLSNFFHFIMDYFRDASNI